MLSQKYGRTYHYPFSPGTTSDDRINHTYWEDIRKIETIVHTEKLDGENNCLNQFGVFARSHAAPTTSPWTNQIRERCDPSFPRYNKYKIYYINNLTLWRYKYIYKFCLRSNLYQLIS